jgi:hypothetical protein
MPEIQSSLETQLQTLVDEANIATARRKGDQLLSTLNQTQVNQLRHEAKHDLFFLCAGVLQYSRLSPNLHGNLCKWLMENRDKRFKEILLPRGHFKSTIVTVGDSIRIVLPNDDDSILPWPEALGSSCRILIAHEVVESASKFLYEITQHFLSNPWMLALFPECVPTLRKERISTRELELPRLNKHKEATFSTMGVGGKSQGAHFNYLKLDDLIGKEARDSKTIMNSAKSWVDNIQSFFSAFVQDHLDVIGTRWAFDDLYEHIHERYGPQLHKYIRGAEVVKDGKLVPLFSEEFTPESFVILKKDKGIWAAQYANDPSIGSTEFQQSWRKSFVWDGSNGLRYKGIDGAINHVDTDDLDRVILIDPAMEGKAGFVVTGMDYIGNIFTLEAMKDNWNPPELADLVWRMVDKWNPRLVAIEKVLFSGLFEHWFKDRMKLTGKFFRVEPIQTENKIKEARVRGLANYFAAGQIYFHPDQRDIITEFNQFGATEDYHILDALAQGPKVWRKGINNDWLRKKNEAISLVMDSSTGKHPIGGY